MTRTVQQSVVRASKSALFYCLVETAVEKEEVRLGCAETPVWIGFALVLQWDRFVNQHLRRGGKQECWRWGFLFFCCSCFAENLDRGSGGSTSVLTSIGWKWHVKLFHTTVSALDRVGEGLATHCQRDWWLPLTVQPMYISKKCNWFQLIWNTTSGGTLLSQDILLPCVLFLLNVVVF